MSLRLKNLYHVTQLDLIKFFIDHQGVSCMVVVELLAVVLLDLGVIVVDRYN